MAKSSETWKDIPGYEGRYQVSDHGRVKALPRRVRFVSKKGAEAWRLTTEHMCAQNITRKGYVLVHFQVDGVRSFKTVHEIVAAAFIGPRPAGAEINHKDGDKRNNAPSNLEYMTSSENKNHAVQTGLNTQAHRVRALRACRVVAEYPSMASAARAVGVTVGSIQYAVRKSTFCQGFRWVRA